MNRGYDSYRNGGGLLHDRFNRFDERRNYHNRDGVNGVNGLGNDNATNSMIGGRMFNRGHDEGRDDMYDLGVDDRMFNRNYDGYSNQARSRSPNRGRDSDGYNRDGDFNYYGRNHLVAATGRDYDGDYDRFRQGRPRSPTRGRDYNLERGYDHDNDRTYNLERGYDHGYNKGYDHNYDRTQDKGYDQGYNNDYYNAMNNGTNNDMNTVQPRVVRARIGGGLNRIRSRSPGR